jgi:hypothetical protein
MILYLKDPKDRTKNTLKSDKHVQQNSRIQNQHTKFSSFLYTNNGKAEKEIENNPIHNSLKKIIKYLGINQTKEGKDLYKERN